MEVVQFNLTDESACYQELRGKVAEIIKETTEGEYGPDEIIERGLAILRDRKLGLRGEYEKLGMYLLLNGQIMTHNKYIYGIKTMIILEGAPLDAVNSIFGFLICTLEHARLCLLSDEMLSQGRVNEAIAINIKANELRRVLEVAAYTEPNKFGYRESLADIYKELGLSEPEEFVIRERPERVRTILEQAQGRLLI
jgi:hypothetical protein